MVPITKVNGTVSYVDANEIVVKDNDGMNIIITFKNIKDQIKIPA